MPEKGENTVLHFTSKGFLMPDEAIETSLEIFRKTFVDEMPTARRRAIFENFEQFCLDVFRLTGLEMFEIWVDGSFVNRKENPEDIDFVVFLDAASKLICDKKWPKGSGRLILKTQFMLDVYFVRLISADQPDYHSLKSDLAYWHFLFARSKEDRFGKTHPKGFLKLKITKNEAQKNQPIPH